MSQNKTPFSRRIFAAARNAAGFLLFSILAVSYILARRLGLLP